MPFLNEKWYNILKWVAVIFLPAAATTTFTIGTIWSWDNVQPWMGTIVALNALLGVSLGLSTASYNASDAKYDGTIDPRLANASTGDSVLYIPGADNADFHPKDVLLRVQDSPIVEF